MGKLKKNYLLVLMLCAVTLAMGCTDEGQDVEKPVNDQEVVETEIAEDLKENEEAETEIIEEIADEKVIDDALFMGKVVNGTAYLYETAVFAKNPESIDVLVNKQNVLRDDYEPADLMKPDVAFVENRVEAVKYMRKEAGLALEIMFNEAKEDEMALIANSGYRSFAIQKTLFSGNVSRKGSIEKANKTSALPGQSEHQTGLVMDVTCKALDYTLKYSFDETDEGKWLIEHAHEYGFIIRYLEDKTEITGYNYEPWHLRYVGKEMAKEIHDAGIVLEEYQENREN